MYLNALVLWTSLVVAQTDTSLTRDFGHLSAKERARIAKQEQEEAAKDTRYQAVMAEAEGLFQQQRYDEALVKFTEARSVRPYNVYPKVKIQDLQALIAKRDAQQAAQADTVVQVPLVEEVKAPPVPSQVTGTPPPKVDPPAEVVVVRPKEEVNTVPPPEKPRVVAHPRDTVRVVSPPVGDPVPKAPDGTTERTYKEGRAIVLERQVVADGKTVMYKKVTHPWGELVYFKDGIAIPARVWNEAFGVR